METGKVLVGVIELIEAKRLRAAMLLKGVELELVNNPETCSSGACSTAVEVHASQEGAALLKEFLQGERAKVLEGLEFDAELENAVFDPEKDQATCPACGTTFSTKLQECPDCGLGFAGAEIK